MRNSLYAAGNVVFALMLAPALVASGVASTAQANDRALPMRFELRQQGPSASCHPTCKTWISASGAITADSPRDFRQFMASPAAQSRDLRSATMVLDSDGGSVLGAIALGREIRKAALSTTVGRVIELADRTGSGPGDLPRGVYSPRADCESMCAFVVLAGVQRSVPAEARVMVHQIWLGDRRDDPTAANYSAEDLVLVQRDIGRLAQFTAEMGGSMHLLDLALRIPPWEPLHVMTRDEIRRSRLATDDDIIVPAPPATVAETPPVVAHPEQQMTSGARASPISERRWGLVNREGGASLARRHPLTVEGDSIGSFDLVVSCGGGDSYEISYVERRHGSDSTVIPKRLDGVSLRVGRTQAALKVVSSERRHAPDQLVSYAAGPAPAALIRAFTAPGSHSMTIETTSRGMVTVIRIGNTGARQNLPQLAANCARPLGGRAEAATLKTGELALAR